MEVLLTLVVAAAKDNAIGKNNQLLWRLPNDMKYFKNVTWGMPVLMGRKTFEALGKPLNGRKNMVLTTQAAWSVDGTQTVRSINEAITMTKEMDVKELMIIGGGQIYQEVIDRADRIHMTRVDADFSDADAFFPPIDPGVWKLVSQKDHEADVHHLYNYSFQVWERY